MITDSDIIRILSDERLDRKILAVIRRALRATEEPEHVSESEKPLPTTWGMIPIRDAAKKYGRTMEDISAAISARHCKGNDAYVDEESLRLWHYDGRKRGLPPMERPNGELSEEDVAEMRAHRNPEPAAPVVASLSIAEAAERLALSEESITDHILAGSMKGVGDDRVAESSVLKYLEVLRAAGTEGGSGAGAMPAAPAPGPARAPAPALDDIMTTTEAAAFLGIAVATVSAMGSTGKLRKLGYGKVSKASVVAYKTKRDGLAPAPAPEPGHTPPVTSRSANGDHVEAPQAPVAIDPNEPVMTTAEAADYLGRTAAHVSVDCSTGRLVRARRGYITRASVEALYADRKKRGIAVPEHEQAPA